MVMQGSHFVADLLILRLPMIKVGQQYHNVMGLLLNQHK